MRVHTEDNKLVLKTELKTFHFDLLINVDSVKHETDFTIRHNKFLAEHIIKNEIRKLLSKYKNRNNIHEHRKQQNE